VGGETVSPVIETVGLTKRYGARRGIDEVAFSVAEGEVFGFLGPNGAGKTTTIRLLLGAIAPTAGHATIFGIDCWREAPRAHAKLAFLGSDPGFLGELTGREQLEYLCGLRRLPRDAWRPLAERLELDPSVRIGRLSRGNRQKIGVVAAFMGHEPLIILDEPTSGLDPLMQREFLELVAAAKADGRTVFLSSHYLPEVERSCDRVGIVRGGRLVEVSSVSGLLDLHLRSVRLAVEAPPPPDTFTLPNVETVSADNAEIHLLVRGDLNPLLGRLAGLRVRDLTIEAPDIEDAFMRFYSGAGDAPATTEVPK
jgi:ABC-2 type transport system ATP-binding protein